MKDYPLFPMVAIVVMLGIAAYAIISSGGDDDTSPPVATETALPAGAKSVQFLSPLPGSVVSNPVTMSMAVGNGFLVPAGDTSDPDGGHLHVFIDRDPPGVGETIEAGDGIVDLSDGSNEVTLPNLSPGEHTISAVYTDTNHVVWDPAPVATGTFTVE